MPAAASTTPVQVYPYHVPNRNVSIGQIYPMQRNTSSFSDRSYYSSQPMSMGPSQPFSPTDEAQVICQATTQAISAARSILLAGGTQSSALSTAKAAAQSVLLPTISAGERPPLNPQKKGFFGRRKNKHQAEIIASMALVSVNSAMQCSTPRGEANRAYSIYPDMAVPEPDTHSEITDDYSQFRNISPSTSPLTNNNLTNYDQRHSQAQITGQALMMTSEHQMTSRSLNSPMSPSPVEIDEFRTGSSSESPLVVRSQSTKSLKHYNIFDLGYQPSSPQKTTDGEYFRKKLMRAEEEKRQILKEPRTKIPSQMPMPRSRTDGSSTKATDRSRTDLASGNADRDDPIYESSSLAGKTKREALDTVNSSFSFSSASQVGISAASDGSTSGGSTYDEDDTTLGASKMLEEKSRFFGSVDPLFASFTDVFSCGPDATLPSMKQIELQHDRNIFDTLYVPNKDARVHGKQQDRRDETSQANTTSTWSKADSESLLRELNLSSIDGRHDGKRPATRKQPEAVSMEELVLRALSMAQPQTKATLRPTNSLSGSNSRGMEEQAFVMHDNSKSSQYNTSVKSSMGPIPAVAAKSGNKNNNISNKRSGDSSSNTSSKASPLDSKRSTSPTKRIQLPPWLRRKKKDGEKPKE